MEKATNVEESGEASRRDDVCRDGRHVVWRARIAGQRCLEVAGDDAWACGMSAGSREQRENDSTKLSSILTVQNSKFHIETRKIARMKVVHSIKL